MNIKVKNLSKKFNNFIAVNNINFTLEKNKTLGLLGSNGCGSNFYSKNIEAWFN